ncbi:MAG: type VI secretion system protein TssL [Deltaproteobacteria bacterium HGW-Deltaproteobacteria-14]|jgi:chemotaxis protein MotB|nr:MAG: type VI secretion system protein TssL [Deltaproteobacteria bacterium HGW-Deltaproteobacteria-14]
MSKHAPPTPAGLPAWLATFADLMTLLMAFFVLLLSMSEIDALKYRAVAGSMQRALGMKIDSIVETLPEGDKRDVVSPKSPETGSPGKPTACEVAQQAAGEVTDSQFELVKQDLAEFAAEHNLVIKRQGHKVLIRIQEQGVFPSGSDRISPVFLPTIAKVRDTLAKLEGGIRVTGHSDDIPISNGRFRSNWELSAARAVSVVHELLHDDRIAPSRVSAIGFGDSRPLVPNMDDDTRAINRRVDIVVLPVPD